MMMRSAGGALAVAVAALLVCCNADPHQEQDVSGSEHNSGDRYDAAGHKTAEPVEGGNLVRAVREVRHSGYVPYLISRRYDFASPYGGKRESWPLAPVEYGGYYGDGLPKRNFDEIDRSGLDTFVKKRNFDEIDRSSMPFPYATKRFYYVSRHYPDGKSTSGRDGIQKRNNNFDEIDLSSLPFPYTTKRFYHLYRRNYPDSDKLISSVEMKRSRPDYPMDEIDMSSLPFTAQRP